MAMKRGENTHSSHATTQLKILKERFLLSDAEVAQLSERGLKTAKAANDLYQFRRC